MTKFLSTLWILLSVVHFSSAKPLEHEDSDIPAKRGYGSYYSNSYFDQIAMSVCASLPSPAAKRIIFPVRRRCPSKDSCDQICKSRTVIAQLYPWANGSPHCMESLHLYKGRPQLAPNPGSTNIDVNRVGLVIKRYHSCHVTECGPNYCCCRKG
ncbi:uncharacterized protein LOC116308971 isoform X2 [Actinia tenebrosa]|uniref:Uncharacterized protein LOC116308971 isoform X2 n=1 Tax=Actinia tenebrosa TaxID=6105 RepID=A0A6P8J5G9_ACTTE|nr:uncharacterized protein LOC116308971 isoform X2 [Actinia tenebrosa]